MNLFLQLNLLLGVSGILVVLLDKAFQLLAIRVSFSKALRFSQLIFILSIALPLTLKLLPSTSIKGVPSKTFTSYAEGMSQIVSVERVITQKPIQVIPQHMPKEESLAIDYNSLIVFIWLLGFCYFLSRFAINYFQVKRLLLKSVPIKAFRRISIVASQEVFVPFSVRMPKGFWVVVPALLLSEKKDLDLAIQHEIQHHCQATPATSKCSSKWHRKKSSK